MEASIRWVQGMTFIGRSGSGHSIVLGSSTSTEDAGPGGPSPMELVLLGLGGCSGIDVVSILEKKRQPVKGFEILLHAGRVDEPPRVFSDVEMEYVLYGAVDPKAAEDAVRLSHDKYCSVSAMVGVKAHITYRIRIEAEA